MPSRALLLFLLAVPLVAACGSSSGDTASSGTSTSTGGSGGAGGSAGGGGSDACAPAFDDTTVHLTAGASLDAGDEKSMCLRWTAPESISIHGFKGSLGPALGHHALLIAQATPAEPDGLAPCSEADLMDAQTYGDFSLLAGVSYESDGVAYEFPSKPVQVGLFVPAGTQLILDAHFLNTGSETKEGCASIDLYRGKPVVAKLQFRTVLPKAEYGLVVPAHGQADVTYEEPVGGAFRLASVSSHMHQGGTHFRMTVKETGKVLYESTSWAEPEPALFDAEKVVLEDGQTFVLDCSFENSTAKDQKFPAQMCVGGMYLLPCSLPGAC